MSATTAAVIQQLYVAYFNRPADPAGLAAWAGALDAGFATEADISAAFAASPEYKASFAGMRDADVVTKIYANLFARAPEPGGLAAWSGALAAGTIPVDRIVADVAGAAQNADADTLRAKVDAAGIYTAAVASAGLEAHYTGTMATAKQWLATVVSAETAAQAVRDIGASLQALAPGAADGQVHSPAMSFADLIGPGATVEHAGAAGAYRPAGTNSVLDFSGLAAPLHVADKHVLEIVTYPGFQQYVHTFTITATAGAAAMTLDTVIPQSNQTYAGLVGTAFDDTFDLGPTLGNRYTYSQMMDENGQPTWKPNGYLSVVDGGAGTDTFILDTTAAQTVLRKTPDGLLMLDDTYLLDIERLQFSDGTQAAVADLMAAYDQKKIVWTATAAALLSPTGTGTPSGQGDWQGKKIVIGTAGPDTIAATVDDKLIVMAGNGGDTVTLASGGTPYTDAKVDYSASTQGIAASDTSTAAGGDIRVTLAGGADTLHGVSSINGSVFDDEFFAGPSLQFIDGGRGADTVHTSFNIYASTYTHYAEQTFDTLVLSTAEGFGARTRLLASGIETLSFSSGPAIGMAQFNAAMQANPGADIVIAEALFAAGASAADLSCADVAATLGTAADDSLAFSGQGAGLFGGAGNDVFRADAQASGASHFLLGGAGANTADYSGSAAALDYVAASGAEPYARAAFHGADGTLRTDYLRGIGTLVGSAGDDLFHAGLNAMPVLDGSAGTDTLALARNDARFSLDQSGKLVIYSMGQHTTVSNIETLALPDGSTCDLAAISEQVKAMSVGPGVDFSLETVRRLAAAHDPARPAGADPAPYVVKDGAGAGLDKLDFTAKAGGVLVRQTATGVEVEDYTLGGVITAPAALAHVGQVTGSGLDDRFEDIGTGIARIDGGAGTDTVILGTRASDTWLSVNAEGNLVVNGTVLANIERLQVEGSNIDTTPGYMLEFLSWYHYDGVSNLAKVFEEQHMPWIMY